MKHVLLILFLGTCTKIIPPNITVSYDSAINANGRYSKGTKANVSCTEGFQLYGLNSVSCESGVWDEPIEQFRCVPNNRSRCFAELHWM